MGSRLCFSHSRNGTHRLWIVGILVLLAATMAASSGPPVRTTREKGKASESHFPSLNLVNATMRTTALRDFAGHHEAFVEAHQWQHSKLLKIGKPAPHLACAEYGKGCDMREQLMQKFPSSGIYTISHTTKYGACFVFTSDASEAEELISDPSISGLTSVGPFLSMLKISPGLLDHTPEDEVENADLSSGLRTTYGRQVMMSDLHGLSIRLSPGVMKTRDLSVQAFAEDWNGGFESGSLDAMKSFNFWADPEMLEGEEGHLTRPQAKMLAHEWTSAAEVLEKKIAAEGGSASDVCEWHKIRLHPADDDLVLATEMDHLLPGDDEEPEIRVSCFMYFLSHLASKPEVFHVTYLPKAQLMNDVVSAIVQSANIFDQPLTDAGLNGTGQVIQIIDTGLDETSCFFVDEDGMEIDHGSYFDGYRGIPGFWYPYLSPTSSYIYDLTRRKIIQYIDLFKRADPDVTQIDGDGYYYYSDIYGSGGGDGYHEDEEEGHGTGVAGVAAGEAISDFEVSSCSSGTQAGCVGKCITAADADSAIDNDMLDIDTYCPLYSCDGSASWSPNCLTGDVEDNLRKSRGVAPGAKLSIFDVSHGGDLLPRIAGNGLWEVSIEAGANIHSNSWGAKTSCELKDEDVLYDQFMYENPEHLLIFAAGNWGGDKDFSDGFECTVLSPGLGKNALTVGASSTGPTRGPTTGADGLALYQELGLDPDGPVDDKRGPPSTSTTAADIDTLAYFSSYGPTQEGRIKPEVVAPGDRVFTASSDGTDDHSCQLLATSGTSFSAPAVAGAAALVRQYFMDRGFYVNDVETRGWCYAGSSIMCDPFSPSASTVKAVLINSAHLMGGDTAPDMYQGFGRVHLEAGLTLGGLGKKALFVVDSSIGYVGSYDTHTYTWDVDPSAGEDIRVTLSWIDPPSDVLSYTQLIHDLDLAVTGPDGVVHYMWDGRPSAVNVNERVIIPASEVVSGGWKAEITSGALTTTYQSYSLVITAAFA